MDPFVGDWNIDTWTPNERIEFEGIPEDGFLVQGTLTITQPVPEVNLFNAQWLNQVNSLVTVSGLERVPETPDFPPFLQGLGVLVNFAGRGVVCNLTLALTTESTLDGSISLTENFGGAPDTGSGTFTAQASSGNNTYARRP